MNRVYFVTGTDTDAGKTAVATGLLYAAREVGWRTAALKPVAAGCESTPDGAGARNADALALQAAITEPLDYDSVNPVAVAPAIAPHLALADAGRRVTVEGLAEACRPVLARRADLTLIEGAGGWRVPLNRRETLADLARLLATPVILVVGLRLGCLNHALLTAEAIRADGLTLAGWVATVRDPVMPALSGNLETLHEALDAPCLGEVPYLDAVTPSAVAAHLDIGKLA